MIVLAYTLFVAGCILGFVGDLRFMVATYRIGLGWFFTCLFLPFAGWIFLLMYFREAWRSMLLSTVGLVMALIGYCIGGFDF